MKDENKEIKGIASAIVSVLDKDTKGFISMWVFVLAPMFFMMALFGFGKFIYSIGEEKENCWDVKVVKEKIIKINTCTGEIKSIEELDSKAKHSKAK